MTRPWPLGPLKAMAPSSRTERLQHTEGEMVDGLHRGIGIVDRRREGRASDVDLLSGAESDVLLMVRSKPIRRSERAPAAFKDPALASGRPARRPIPSQEQFPHHSTRVALIETSWSATTPRPKPTGMIATTVVIIEVGSAGSVGCALEGNPIQPRPRATAIWDSRKPATIAPRDAAAGMTHNPRWRTPSRHARSPNAAPRRQNCWYARCSRESGYSQQR
jgi:hypothetical protein